MKVGRRPLVVGSLAALGMAACRSSSRVAASRRPEFVVVGAGLSGLAVAYDLTREGREVIVLEAQGRAGGRILTIRAPFTDDLYVEAGAKHVVGDPDLMALCDSLDVKVEKPPRSAELPHPRYAAGARTLTSPGQEIEPTGLLPEESRLGFVERLRRCLGPVNGVPPMAMDGSGPLGEYDQISAAEWLRRQQVSPAFVSWVEDAFTSGDGIEQTSALSLMREAASILHEIEQGGGGRVVGGSDRLPMALAARLHGQVVYGARVVRMEQSDHGVRVAFVRNGATEWLETGRMICAIPYSVLRHVEIAPAFSMAKRRVIRELRMASVVRIWLQSDRRFWNERGESGNASTDGPIGDLQDETSFLPGVPGILSAYVTRERARKLCALGAEARLAAALEDVEKVHAGMRQHFVVGASKCWDDDPHARGAYAWFSPGQMTAFGDALWAAEGRIHFAGDHTSHRPGFMHGALASAKRVLREVQRS